MNLARVNKNLWSLAEIRFFRRLKDPMAIQLFLNSLPYNPESTARSPRQVLRTKTAHCFEGALFAAAALSFLGYPPKIVDLMAENDDDHVIAIFKDGKYWGAVAKSNTTVLRFREPVYRTLRELVMSYFDFYFNTKGEKTLRSYSRPVGLRKYDRLNWMTTLSDVDWIGDNLFGIHHIPIAPSGKGRQYTKTDPDLMKAGFMGADEKGLFKAR